MILEFQLHYELTKVVFDNEYIKIEFKINCWDLVIDLESHNVLCDAMGRKDASFY